MGLNIPFLFFVLFMLYPIIYNVIGYREYYGTKFKQEYLFMTDKNITRMVELASTIAKELNGNFYYTTGNEQRRIKIHFSNLLSNINLDHNREYKYLDDLNDDIKNSPIWLEHTLIKLHNELVFNLTKHNNEFQKLRIRNKTILEQKLEWSKTIRFEYDGVYNEELRNIDIIEICRKSRLDNSFPTRFCEYDHGIVTYSEGFEILNNDWVTISNNFKSNHL